MREVISMEQTCEAPYIQREGDEVGPQISAHDGEYPSAVHAKVKTPMGALPNSAIS